MENMTVLTEEIFDQSRKAGSVEEAVDILLTYQHFRTLGDVLRKFLPDPDLKGCLVAGLCRWFPEDKPEAIDRKVRNWLNGKTQALSKRDAYVISRVLHLPLEQANEFLQYATGESIHWREPEDIVWCYSIVHNLDPAHTALLMEQAKAILAAASEPEEKTSYTADVQEKLLPVLYEDEAALLKFLETERSHLGTLHNTAFQLFENYMEVLKKGYSEYGMEERFKEMTKADKKAAQALADGDVGPRKAEEITVRDVLETYLYRKLVPVQARGTAKAAETFSAVQRSIRQNWPDEFALSKMESRKQNVSRKVLILLFLATDGTGSDFDELEEPETVDEVFQSVSTRLDEMLDACGFPPLDPRNPFDWMILFCIASGDLWEIDARLGAMLTSMFST